MAQEAEQQETNETLAISDPGKRQKLAIIGGISIVALVLVLVVVIPIMVQRDKSTCLLEKDEPHASAAAHKAIPSPDNQALVRFAGYLELKPSGDEALKYLGLTLQHVLTTVHDGFTHLILDTDCSVIELRVEKTDVYYILNRITIKPKAPNARFKICQINLREHIERNKYWSCENFYYYCDDLNSMTATSDSKKTQLSWAAIRFKFFEFELDGEPINMMEGQFDKIPKLCQR